MKLKNKIIALILNIVPGMGQIYLGFVKMGILFLCAILGLIFCFLTGTAHMGFDELFITYILLFFVANISCVVQSMIAFKETNALLAEAQLSSQINKKTLAMLFSIIPGVGHLYIGFTKKGIELMIGFFLSFYLTDFMRVSIFLILAPVIWFYTMFDVMHRISSGEPVIDEHLGIVKWFNEESAAVTNKNKLLGYALLFLGGILLLTRNITPVMERILWSNFHVEADVQTAVVGLILCYGGIRLIGKNSKNLN